MLVYASYVGLRAHTDLCTPCERRAARSSLPFLMEDEMCCSLSQRDCWEGLKKKKAREGKHGNVSSDSTSQGTLTSSRETKIKIPFSLPSQHNRKMGSRRRGGGSENNEASLFFAPDGCFLTAQSFCSAEIRGHCSALRGCQTL